MVVALAAPSRWRAQLQGLPAGARRELDALDRAAERLAIETCGGDISEARLEALAATETLHRLHREAVTPLSPPTRSAAR